MTKLRVLFLGVSAFSILVGSASARAVTLISDIDDTIKVSHVNSVIGIVKNVRSLNAFPGMASVYQSLATSGSVTSFYYLSGSPRLLSHHLHTFLNANQFPKGSMMLRGFREGKDVGDYKLARLRKLLPTLSEKVVLVGDDTEKDADVFAQIKSEFPSKVDAIYIHRVTGRDLSVAAVTAGASVFMTSADLAAELFQDEKLSAGEVLATTSLLLADDSSPVIARFQKCLSKDEALAFTGIQTIDLDLMAIQNKAQDECKH